MAKNPDFLAKIWVFGPQVKEKYFFRIFHSSHFIRHRKLRNLLYHIENQNFLKFFVTETTLRVQKSILFKKYPTMRTTDTT